MKNRIHPKVKNTLKLFGYKDGKIMECKSMRKDIEKSYERLLQSKYDNRIYVGSKQSLAVLEVAELKKSKIVDKVNNLLNFFRGGVYRIYRKRSLKCLMNI